MGGERLLCGWVRFRQCGEILYGGRFLLELNEAVYKSNVRRAVLSGGWALWPGSPHVFAVLLTPQHLTAMRVRRWG